MKRYLVISGGGSKGAYAAGLTNRLYEMGVRWTGFYGTSTGSLLSLLISKNDFDSLKNLYTNVENKDVFDKPPFTKKGKLNIFRTLYRLLTGKNSIGSANNLYELIKKTFTISDYCETTNKGLKICACATNYTKGTIEYGSNFDNDYDTFLKYVFASASVPIAMDLVKIGDDEYLDGGVMEHVPIQKAIDDDADIIDVIILRPNYSEHTEKWKSKNIPTVAFRTIDLFMKEISDSDVIVGTLKAHRDKTVRLNFYYTNEKLTGNSLTFNKEKMLEWWNLGYNLIGDFQVLKNRNQNNKPIKTYTI